MGTSYIQGFLHGESILSNNVSALTEGVYDLAFFASSWDRRCISITQSDSLKSRYGVIFLFSTYDELGLRKKHDQILFEYVNSHCDTVTPIKGESVDVEDMWNKLSVEINRIQKEINQPLRIFLDLSTYPRFYALGILGSCFCRGIVESINIFYSEGIYRKTDEAVCKLKDYNFSEGHWKIMPIPFMEGTNDPGKKKYYLISVGFEGDKTFQAVSREDPERISILFPEPGFLHEYVNYAKSVNGRLIQKYKVTDEQIVKVHAGDAIGVWKSLANASLERPTSENTYYLCCGTKPHSIGLGLRAITLKYPTVLYRVPGVHGVTNIEPNNNYWSFKVIDLSSPLRLD